MDGYVFPDMLAAVGTLILTGVGIYASLLVLTRVMGLRSFSKMSSMDFATTVALGHHPRHDDSER